MIGGVAFTAPSPALLVTGGVLIVIGLIVRRSEKRSEGRDQEWFNRAARADGVVSRIVDLTQALSKNKVSEYDSHATIPVVRFRAANGVEYEIDAPGAPHEIGTAVAVAYDSAVPSSARVVTSGRRFGCGVLLLLIGSGVIVYAFM